MTDKSKVSFGLADIARLDFRTSRAGDAATASIQRELELSFRYQPARLALGRSLGIATQPTPVDNFDGRAIRGETLFGLAPDEIGMWFSLIAEHAGVAPDRRALQELVAAHWARGAGLLWDGLRDAKNKSEFLAEQLLRERR